MFTDCLEMFCERLSHIQTKCDDGFYWNERARENTRSNNGILRLKADGRDFLCLFFYYYFSNARLILGAMHLIRYSYWWFLCLRSNNFLDERRKLKTDYKWMLRTKDLLLLSLLLLLLFLGCVTFEHRSLCSFVFSYFFFITDGGHGHGSN